MPRPVDSAPLLTASACDRTLAATITLKADDAGEQLGVFTGVASAVDVIDSHGEVIAPGAFDASLAAKGDTFPMLWQHDHTQPIGVFRLSVDPATGNLRARGELNLDTRLGQEAYALLKQGAIGAMSIGFNIPSGSLAWDDERKAHVIHAVDLWECSLVTWPANPAALVDAVKAQALAVKAGRVLSAANRAKVEAAIDALQAVLDAADSEKRDDTTPPPPPSDSDPNVAIGHHAISAELGGVKRFIQQVNAELVERAQTDE